MNNVEEKKSIGDLRSSAMQMLYNFRSRSIAELLHLRASDLDFCVRCGVCKALCPTYLEEATEGMSARGRIMLLRRLVEGELEPSKKLDDAMFSCMLCGACNKLCPLGIGVTDAVYRYRRDLRGFNNKRKVFTLGAKFAFKNASTAAKALKLLEAVGEILPIHKLGPFRAMREMGIDSMGSPLRDDMSIFKVSRPKGRIAVFAGCAVNYLYPDIGRSLIRSLNTMSYEVILPKGEVCCGAPLMGLGLEDDARELAERNMTTFKKMKVEAVIGLCPTCVHFIKNEYKGLVEDGIENAVEVSQFFGDKIPPQPPLVKGGSSLSDPPLGKGGSGGGTPPLKVVYHDPCHSVNHLEVKDEPRRILSSLGLPPVDSEGGCCGSGGVFKLLYRGLSEGILQKRIADYRKADMIVTSCPNCIVQLRSKIKDKQIKHIAELIEGAVKGERDERGR